LECDFAALNALLREGSFAIDGEDAVLAILIPLSSEYPPLLSHGREAVANPGENADAVCFTEPSITVLGAVSIAYERQKESGC
jgi:hypothetical protein